MMIKAEQRFDLTRRAHYLVQIDAIDRGVCLHVI
jgi:hypothetical protein